MKKPSSVTRRPEAAHTLFIANPALWEGAASILRMRRYAREDRIVSRGDAADSLWLVYRGWVKLTRQTPDGKETIVGLCTAGDLFGEAALFAGACYPSTAEVVGGDAELAAIPSTILRTVIADNAPLSASIMRMMSACTAQEQLKLEHMNTMSAAQRLGCFLLRLCYAHEGDKTLHIPIEKNVLASYLGMKPETLSRSQQQLKSCGITISGTNVNVDDIKRLREFVCSSCSESGECKIENAAR